MLQLSIFSAFEKCSFEFKFDLVFTRIPDNAELARQWRFPAEGPSINDQGEIAPVNLFEYVEDLARIRFTYLYIQPTGCEITEQCAGGSGWRRLMIFTTTSVNFGIKELYVGQVSYYADGAQTDYVTKHRIYEYSPCHKHFHYTHFVKFAFGTQNQITNTKRGFCLESVYRHANAEWSVMSHNYYTCSNQGIAPGWSDEYNGGIR